MSRNIIERCDGANHLDLGKRPTLGQERESEEGSKVKTTFVICRCQLDGGVDEVNTKGRSSESQPEIK